MSEPQSEKAVLTKFEYSMLEQVVFAFQMSQEDFVDPYAAAAAKTLGIDVKDVTVDQRMDAKNGLFKLHPAEQQSITGWSFHRDPCCSKAKRVRK